MTDVRIVPTREVHVEGFNAAVGAIARERLYIGLVAPPPLIESREFVRKVLEDGGVHLVAVDAAESVVGWCDIARHQREGFRHTGRLGMGLLPAYRGKGLGRQLMDAAIQRGWESGLERIELEVFASNRRAIMLYERIGFVHEGRKRRARKIDGRYDDDLFMAIFNPNAS